MRLENCLSLDSDGQACLVQSASYSQRKRRKFKRQVGRWENMTCGPEEGCFTCV